MRSRPHANEGRLDPIALRWLAAFPAAARPAELCARYPRIANRLALCWSDPVLSTHVLNELLIDRRGGRQGFPPAVRSDLLALREQSVLDRRRLASQRTAPLSLLPRV